MTLATVAQDVKIQVEFNPKTVKEYCLIGYKNHLLNQEDFNNDKVDVGHRVTALYEIIPVGQKGDDSRYQAQQLASAVVDKEYAFLKLRYKKPGQDESQLSEQVSADTRFALAVASFAQQLKGGEYNGEIQWSDILNLAQVAAQPNPYALRAEFVDLIKLAQQYSVSETKLLKVK